MKRQAFMILTTLSLFVMLTATSVHAQSDMRLKVNIPFEFSVETKVLPAGEYTVGQIVQNAQNVLLICRVDGSASDVFMTIPREAGATPSESKLVFNRYGDRYFLSKIWTGGNDTGRELLESRVEGELLRAFGRPESSLRGWRPLSNETGTCCSLLFNSGLVHNPLKVINSVGWEL